MSLVTLIILFVILVSFIIRDYVKNKSFNKLFFKLPSPPSIPILGHFFLINNPKKLLAAISNMLDEFDGFVSLYVGPWYKGIMVSDHKLVHLLSTNNNVRKSDLYKVFYKWMGINLFTANGEYWMKYRKFLTPVFHLDILKQFIGPFNSVSNSLIEELKKKTDKPLDIHYFSELWALDATVESAMGISVNALKNSDSKYVRYLHEITKIIERRLVSPVKTVDFFFWFSRDYWKEREIVKYIKSYTSFILKEKIKARNQRILSTDDSNIDNNKKLAFLDLFIEKRGTNITDQDLCNHVELILFGGLDTSSKSLAYTLYLLSIHSEIQERAFAEVRLICGDDKSYLCTFQDLQKMTYLEMVIKESLRLYPPGPFIAKHIMEDIEYNGYTIPKDTEVAIVIFDMHRKEKYFPNPLKFDPERFTPENQTKITPYTYIPFSAGPRNCIGQKIAMLQMKVALSMVLRNFKVLPAEGFHLELLFNVVLKPGRDGVQIVLQDREY